MSRAASPSGVAPSSATASAAAESTSGTLLTPSEGKEGLGYDQCVEPLAHPGWCETLVRPSPLAPGERVLVVVDEPLVAEGAQLAAAVKDAGGEPRLELWAGERPLSAAPPGVLEGGREADVSFFLAQAPRGDEAQVRFQLMEAVIGHGGRQIFMGFVDGDL